MHSGQLAQFRNQLQKPEMPVADSAEAPEIAKAGIEPASVSIQETDHSVTNRVLETNTPEVGNVLPEAVMPLDEFVRLIQQGDTRRSALEEVLRQWGLNPQSSMTSPSVDDAAYFKMMTERHGLSMLVIDEDFDALVTLDLPAVITLSSFGDGRPLYASVVCVKDGLFDLVVNYRGAHTRTDALTLKRIWDGKAYIPWKNYLAYPGVIPGGTPRAAIILLKQLLWEIGYMQLIINDNYDTKTRQAVREIQAKHGLAVDGLVGDMTKIALFNEKQSLPIPHLSKRPSADNRTN
jgi:general secretion pathway protein A